MSPPPVLPAAVPRPRLRFPWSAHLEHYLLQIGCQYLPGVYGLYRRFSQWLHRWWPSPLEQAAQLLQIVPPLTPAIGRLEALDHPGHTLPHARIHLEYLHQGRKYRAVVDPSRLPTELARCPPLEWIPMDHGNTCVLPLLQCDYGDENVLPVVEMYAGPHGDFYRDLPWVDRSPHLWLAASGKTPLWSDPKRPIACLWDTFEEVTLTVGEVDRLVHKS